MSRLWKPSQLLMSSVLKQAFGHVTVTFAHFVFPSLLCGMHGVLTRGRIERHWR